MLSSCRTKPTGYWRAALARKNSVIARPTAILTRCCFRTALRLEEEFHLDAGELDHVVILQRVWRGADRLAVALGARRALGVGDEVALGPARPHRDLDPGLAQGGEGLGARRRLAGGGAG